MLLWLKLRLAFHLAIFALQIALIRLGKNRLVNYGLILGILLIWIVNLSLYRQKTEPQIEIRTEENNALSAGGNLELQLSAQELSANQNYYQNLEKTQPRSRDLLFNLGKIYQSTGQSELAAEKLELARELDPNF